uniref:Uncharacterized protein n=1 Tax=Romanomermis culicivorax TaxID=13658 RepID=A0A915IXC9_ROMCU
MTVDNRRDGFCGLASYRPQYLQKFATGFWFTIFSCLVVLIQGVYFGYTIGMLTTIEKRFKINSFRSGSLLSFYDMGHAISVLLIGHFGPWIHKPKWVAFGCLSNALACFGMAASHFLFQGDHEADVVKPWANEPAGVDKSAMELCSMRNVGEARVSLRTVALSFVNKAKGQASVCSTQDSL